MTDRSKGISAILVSAFGFAIMAACVRLSDDCGGLISSFQKSFFRNLIAFAIALVVFLRDPGVARRAKAASRKTWCLILARSVFGTIGIFANFYALSHIPIAEGQTLNKTAPFFTILFAWLFLRERISLRTVFTLTLAFAGVLLITKPGFAGEAAFPLAMGLTGGIAAGSAYAVLRALGKQNLPSAFIILFFSAFSCLASIPFLLGGFDPMTGAQVVILLGAGCGGALGQFGITLAYRFAAPREIAVFDYSNVVFTALFGFALFGQIPDLWSIAGFVLIIAAAFMNASRPEPPTDCRVAASHPRS